jgi:hypothetical protein
MMPLRLRSVLLSLSMLAFACPLLAAELTPDLSAEQVAAESYARMTASEWDSAAETFDPAALKQFRGMIAPILEGPMGEGMIGLFYGAGKTADDIRRMNDTAFFAGFMRNIAGGVAVSLKGQEILGSVPEGADRLHLVTRGSVEAMDIRMTQMEVVTMSRTPQGWRLALSGKFDGMAQAMRKAGEIKTEAPAIAP